MSPSISQSMSSSTRYGLALNGKMSADILMSLRCSCSRGCFSATSSRFASVIARKRSLTGASILPSISKFSVTLRSTCTSASEKSFVIARERTGMRAGENAYAPAASASTTSFIVTAR